MLPDFLIDALYPLGLVASAFFALAFVMQWLISRKHQQHIVPRNFWTLSLVGAVLMMLHGIIQMQLPVALLHAANFMIYFRNLDISSSEPSFSLKTMVGLMTLLCLIVTLPFIVGAYYNPNMQWFASRDFFHLSVHPAGPYWRVLGCLGLLVFALRFFSQWFYLEALGKSTFPVMFWQISLFGGGLAFIYFVRVGDPVNIISYGCSACFSLMHIRTHYLKQRFSKMANSCFISAGEMSGDAIGGDLIRILKRYHPEVALWGVGGPNMRQEGLLSILNMENFQVSGFLEILCCLPKLLLQYRFLYKKILRENPKIVICIDFPDFHLSLIKKLRKKGYAGKIIHYVCPSIWAWRPQRKRFLEKYLDALFLIFPFERQLFQGSSLRAAYVGHPLVKKVDRYKCHVAWIKELNLEEKPCIAAFPGSRYSDVNRNLRVQVRAFLSSAFASTHQLWVSAANKKLEKLIVKILSEEKCPQGYVVPAQYCYELLRSCDCALSKCGTIVLEGALQGTPTVVTCRLGAFDLFLSKYVFKIFLPAYSLPNIIMGKTIFPEFIGGERDFSSENVAAALNMLMHPENVRQQRQECEKLVEKMQTGVTCLEEYVCQEEFFVRQNFCAHPTHANP